MTTETDIIRHVYDDKGNYLIVRPWPDAPDIPVIMTDEISKEHFGLLNLLLPSTDFARALGNALINCANELDEQNR